MQPELALPSRAPPRPASSGQLIRSTFLSEVQEVYNDRQRDVQVSFQQGDMCLIDFHSVFGRVLILFTAFGYFDDAGNAAVLAAAARALKPGGLMCFDSHNRDTVARNFQPSIVTEKDGNLMIDRNSFDCEKGLWFNRRIIIRNGTRHDRPFAIRLYNLNEVHSLLESAGLVLERAAGGWNSEPLSFESRRMVIIARKP